MSSFQSGPGPGPESAPSSGPAGPRDAGSGSEPVLDSDPAAALAEEEFAEQEGVPASGVNDESGSGGDTADRFPPLAEGEGDSPTENDSIARERDDYRDALQRLQADFENYKKRVAKQWEEVRDRAAESLVTELLPVLDTCDLALSHGAGEEMKQLSASLFSVLEKEGLQKIDNAGEPFDPTHHDAVAHEPSDQGAQEVAEVMRAGYRWRGRVLRPAMVKVRG